MKWILILLKAVSVVGAIVSMKRAVKTIEVAQRSARGWEDTALNYAKNVDHWKGKQAAAERMSAAAEQAYKQFSADQSFPEICTCRGCKVLRGLTHGYADRMRGAIRRDIEAESA